MLNLIRWIFLNRKKSIFDEDKKNKTKLESLYVRDNQYEVFIRTESISKIKNYFSHTDNRMQFVPDGEPFQGEFDYYLDIRKSRIFYGYYRISLLPENSLEIHCGFVFTNTFLVKRYLKITEKVLSELQSFFPNHLITSECSVNHVRANKYLQHFCFELKNLSKGVNLYMLNRENFISKFNNSKYVS